MKCRHNHNAEATGLWIMPAGCICFTDTLQALCTQHAIKALNNSIEMELILDLTEADQ